MNRISRILFLCCLFASIVMTAQAQLLPQTNLYLFEVNQKSDSLFIFRKPKFLNKFNVNGYNNQPNFINPNELYLTVQMPEDTTQTDIYSLNLSTNTLTQVTKTVEGEFSPAYMPTSNVGGAQFSAIRVEGEGNQIMQRLWQFPVNRSNNGSPVFKTLDKIGYFCWISPNWVALFVVGPPHTLALADVNTERTTNIASNVGRCIQKLPNSAIAYVQKSSTKWTINKLNPITRLSEPIISTLPNSEDFIVMPDGSLIMGSGSKLFHYRPGKDMDWQEIADLSFYGINNITRLAFNGDKKLVVVSD
jgi:hypothetical protein